MLISGHSTKLWAPKAEPGEGLDEVRQPTERRAGSGKGGAEHRQTVSVCVSPRPELCVPCRPQRDVSGGHWDAGKGC